VLPSARISMNGSYSQPTPGDTLTPDALILGGGVAGLWTLDRLHRAGHSVLLIEPNALGAGQTIWSQGILHSGLKYTLAGALNKAARAIQSMPERWMRWSRSAQPLRHDAPRPVLPPLAHRIAHLPGRHDRRPRRAQDETQSPFA